MSFRGRWQNLGDDSPKILQGLQSAFLNPVYVQALWQKRFTGFAGFAGSIARVCV